VARATSALQAEGFGVLTTIDVQDTLKKKLGAELPRYHILGACNPTLAHQALQAEPGVGLLLPCNVVVAEQPGGTRVQAIKPAAMLAVVKNPALDPVIRDADERLQRAMARLETA
jgi:uncharacterized protein (DUF302 family)